MKTMILAALTALSLGAGVANAQSLAHQMAPTTHQGPYDNTANSLGGRFAGNYGGN
jgi:hypothetical protein